eukprot:COSAG01_NODE_625_length_14726_cov_9.023997_15_plen_464_part_00
MPAVAAMPVCCTVLPSAAVALAAAAAAAAQPPQGPAQPRLNRSLSMSGTGYYSFGGGARSTAALFQDDERQLLRLDLGNLTQPPPQLHAYFSRNKERVVFQRGGIKHCLATKPDGSAGLTYTQQLAAYSGSASLLDFYGTFTFGVGGPGSAVTSNAFAGKVYDGVRGEMAAVVFVDGATSMLQGQLSMFNESCGAYWLTNTTCGAPDPSVFALPAECGGGGPVALPSLSDDPAPLAPQPQSRLQPPPRQRPPASAPLLPPPPPSPPPPQLDLGRTMSGRGTYQLSAPAAAAPVPSRWEQDATTKQLLVAVGDTTGEAWQQVLLYNSSGQYIVSLQQGNPVCEKKPHPTYTDFVTAHAAPHFIFGATVTTMMAPGSAGPRSSLSNLPALNMFAGVATVPGLEGGTEEVMMTDASKEGGGLLRVYDNLNRKRGYGRLVLDMVTPTRPHPDAFDLTKQIVSWLKCV